MALSLCADIKKYYRPVRAINDKTTETCSTCAIHITYLLPLFDCVVFCFCPVQSKYLVAICLDTLALAGELEQNACS